MNDLPGLSPSLFTPSLERLSSIKRHLDNPSSPDAKRSLLYEKELTATKQRFQDDENLSPINEVHVQAVGQNMLSISTSLTPPEQSIQHESQAVCEQRKVPEATKVLELVNKANAIFMTYKSNMCKMLKNMTAYVICGGFDPLPLPEEVKLICKTMLRVRMDWVISDDVISLDINKEEIDSYFDILSRQKLSSCFNEVFGPDYCNHIKNRLSCSIDNHSQWEVGALLPSMNDYVHDNLISFQTPNAPNKTDRNLQLEGGITPSCFNQPTEEPKEAEVLELDNKVNESAIANKPLSPSCFNQPSEKPKEAEVFVLEFISKAIEASKCYTHPQNQLRYRRIIVYALCGGFDQPSLPDDVQSKFKQTKVSDILSNYTNRILPLYDREKIKPSFERLREQKLDELYDNIFGGGRFVQVRDYLLSFEIKKSHKRIDSNLSLTSSSSSHPQSEEPKEADFLAFVSEISGEGF